MHVDECPNPSNKCKGVIETQTHVTPKGVLQPGKVLAWCNT